MTDFTPLTTCLACGADTLKPFLDLGEQPLANAFHHGLKRPPAYPIRLNVCTSCWHSQQSIAVDPGILYQDYAYASGTSATLRAYFSGFAAKVQAEQASGKFLHVLDIASNDGSLLREFAKYGHAVFGIDPAANLAPADIPTEASYFDLAGVAKMHARGWKSFDVIVAMNVLGHVASPVTFLELCKDLLVPGGRIYIQTSQAEMIQCGEYDTCYHEHLSFFTVSSFAALANRAGLKIDKINHVPIHGTSYLVELTDDAKTPQTYDAFELGLREKAFGYYSAAIYDGFAERVAIHVDRVQSTVCLLRRGGYAVVGYGAAAKFMTLINRANLNMSLIVDDAPLKQGKLCPGSNIPIVSTIPTAGKMAWIIGAWNMKDEIIARIRAARPDGDDKFVTCFPAVVIE